MSAFLCSPEHDIPIALARAAHAGTSFVSDERAEQTRAGYAATLTADYQALLRHAPTDEKRATLDAEFARYREGYRRHYVAHLHSRSRCMSTMIAGPSRFPVRRMEKRNRIELKRLDELISFRDRALDAIRKTLHPEWRPIMAGDADALERLREKLAKLEKTQERMKAANAAMRKHAKAGAEAQVFAIVATGLPESIARKLLEPDFAGRLGFPSYEITNGGAEIRRVKARLEMLERVKAEPAAEAQGSNARIEDSPADNRVRLFFPGKPAEDVRDRLKSAGFRWTPSLGCWQAYRNHNSLTVATREAA
jgi:hypothetical protein